jgi:two-component system, sensor histidine kinase ChiS
MLFPTHKRSNIRQFFMLTGIMLLVVASLSLWFAWRVYIIQTEKTIQRLENEAARIERVFSDTIDHTAFIMRMMLMQIKPNYEDPNYIDGIMSKYRTNPNVANVLSWTIFSWANEKHLITVDSVYGVMEKPYDLSNRDYIPLTQKEPDVIHLGKPVYGSTSKRWMIPAGIGITDNTNKYIGAITIGFDIANLTERIKDVNQSEGINFILVDKDYDIVLDSIDNGKDSKGIKHIPEGAFRNFLKKVDFSKEGYQYFTDVNIFGIEDSYYFYKLKKYPYIFYLRHEKQLIKHDLWQALTSRIIEITVLAAIATLLLVVIYRHETRLRTEAEDAHRREEAARKEVEHARNNLEKIVQDRTFELEKALRLKTEFLNNISHEVRTPVQGVTVFTSSLIENWQRWEDEKRYSTAIKARDSAERLFNFVHNILDISKIEAGKMTFDMQPHDINIIAKNIIQECEPLTLSKKIVLVFTPSKDSLVAEIDETRIGQVIRNLIANAVKFTPQGTITLHASSSNVHYEDGRKVPGIKFTVKDEGVGIPDEDLNAIFDAFNQSSRTKTRAGGTGLGLSISKQIVCAHHGRIWAENNPDKGAIFTFVLPLKQPSSNSCE